MKSLVLLLTSAGLAVGAPVERFYLGTGVGLPGEPGIYAGTLDTRTGKLGKLELAASLPFQPFLALTPDGKFLYADAGGHLADLVAYRVETNGLLTKLNELPSGNGSCHVSLDATGRHVFVANYTAGDVAVFSTTTNGFLQPDLSYLRFKGSGPNPKRQDHPYLHSTYVDASNRHLYACDLGTDNIWIFDFDAASGKLTPANPPSAKVSPGSGPRHLAFSQNQSFAYVNGEMGMNVTAFLRNPKTGALTAKQTVSSLPPAADTNGMTTAEIFCNPSGKWLYVSNRDVAERGRDSLTAYKIGSDGQLIFLQNVPAQVKIPRCFAISPDGVSLIVAGQNSNQIALFRIDDLTGRLTFTGETAAIGSPTCVIFVPDQKNR